jgi:UDP-N-acetylmuramoylalanine--D-glutamate ligase
MQRALILGLGESGLAMARWLARASWDVHVADTRAEPPMLGALRELVPQARFSAGDFTPQLLEGAALLALSPGLSPHAAPLRDMVEAAARDGIDAVGEIELFARALAQLQRDQSYAPRVVAVTGTNGKTTTVRMVGRMIERWGRSVLVAGNVSPSALDALRTALEAQRLPDFWVLELSSFQLATTRTLTCSAAAVLNVTEDHLDWHASFQDYAASKARILAGAGTRVYSRDDPVVQAMVADDGAGTVGFGAGAPDRPGQFGLVRDGGLTWLACTDEEEAPRRRRRPVRAQPMTASGDPVPPAPAEAPAVHRLMPVDALAVRGTHNALNALAALALGRAVGVPLAAALRALGDFRGDPHRTETVARIGGVEYVDDSKGTNVGATIAALRGLADVAGGRRIVVILGGDGKGQSFAPLAAAVGAHARAAVLIGKDARQIALALTGLDVPVHTAADLPAAVRAAAGIAQHGDIVLLSPACASFDAFRNYAHRAQVFVAAVQELARVHAAAAPEAGP